MTNPPVPQLRAPGGALLSVSLLLTLALLVSACSGGDGGSAGKSKPSGSASAAAPQLVTQSSLGAIAGRLSPGQRETVQTDVTAIVDDYTNWAYLVGDYPRTEWEFPVPGFSDRASRRVERDLELATNADIGGSIDSVTPVSRKVVIDVLSPKGKLAGATARFKVVFDTQGEAGDAQVVARGRLVLVPDGSSGWQVVGHYFFKGVS